MTDTLAEAAQRASILAACDHWGGASSDWEDAAVEDICRLPNVSVGRPDDETLVRSGMQLNECHHNAAWYAANDRSGASHHVLGWWVHFDLLVLHSVIEKHGQYWCVTPQGEPNSERFRFFPDSKITWIDRDGDRIFSRNGGAIGAGLRRDPEGRIALVGRARERLSAGMSPTLVMKMGDREAVLLSA